MTKKDAARLRRLEAENSHLREQLERQMEIYRMQLYELVDLRTRLDLVREVMGAKGDVPDA